MFSTRRLQPSTREWVTVCVVCAACLIVWSVRDTSTDELSSLSANLSSQAIFSRPHDADRLPLPLWGQDNEHELMSGVLLGIPILMLVTTEDFTVIRRSIESVLQETAGSGLQLVVSVSSTSPSLLTLLQEYPIRTHIAPTSSTHDIFSRPDQFKFLLKQVVPRFSAVSSFSSILRIFTDNDVCTKDELSPEIGILTTGANFSHTSSYRFTLGEIKNHERGTPYMEHPYNPMYRRATINSEQEQKEKSGEDYKGSAGKDRIGSIKEGNSDGQAVCQKSQELKEALQFIKDSFPELQYLVLMETGYVLAPDFVRYLNQTLHATQKDPSVYCISAYNPLALAHSTQTSFHPVNESQYPILDHTHLLRYDHFVATASLIPVKVMNEVIHNFVVYKETAASEKQKSAMAWLETWLSWWSQRQRRACIVPAVPRVCPLTHTTEQDSGSNSHSSFSVSCSNHTDTIFKTKRLLHHEYSQDLIKVVEAAEPLGTKVLNCSDPNFFPEIMNSSIYIIYIKMENYADDFTFHHFMKCFGLDLPSAVGYFEGVFQLTLRNIRILLMGIPYSPFSPSMKNTEALLVADIPDMYIRGQTNYQRFKHRHFNFNTVLVKQKML